VSSQ
jgi:hypothetical protein